MNKHSLSYTTFLSALLVACSSPAPPPPPVPNNAEAAQTDAVLPPTRPVLTTNALKPVNINDSGIGAPQRLWDNTTQEALQTLLGDISNGYISPATQRILARVLQTAAEAPARNAPSADAATFLDLRLQTLATTGNATTAQNLLNTIPQKDYTPSLWKMAVALPLLEGKVQQACALHQTALEKDPDNTSAAKMIFFCQLAAGDRAAAELTLGVLREQANRSKTTDTFIELATFGLEQSTQAPTLETPTLLQIALLSIIQKDVPLTVRATMNPSLFPRLATLPFLWSGTKIAAAEQGVSRGTLDVATLTHLYRSEKFNENEWGALDDAQALGKIAMDDPLPAGRENALLWQKIQRTKALEEKLQLLKKLVPLNAENRTMVAFAKVFYPLLQETPISKQFMSYALTVVPLLVLAGDEDRAGVWFNFLEIEARGNNTSAIDVLATLWPYYALQRHYALDGTTPLNVLLFNGWQQKNKLYGHSVTAYFTALGKKLPAAELPISAATRSDLDTDTDKHAIDMLHTNLLQALGNGDKGKSLLLALRLTQLCAGEYDNAAMRDAFRTLIKYGYDTDAKAIVYEMLALE